MVNVLSRLCAPTNTGHRDWFGCLGVTARMRMYKFAMLCYVAQPSFCLILFSRARVRALSLLVGR